MSDLDKMMSKLKKSKDKVEETPVEETPVEEEDEDEDEDEDDEEIETPTEEKKEDPKVDVNEEVAILQNDGIYRRELLGALRELVNVQMVNAQALIDLNKLIGGALNGKKK